MIPKENTKINAVSAIEGSLGFAVCKIGNISHSSSFEWIKLHVA